MKRLLLLDANVIIDLHTLELFDRICSAYDVYVTPEVLKESDRFPKNGRYHKISLKDKVKVVREIDVLDIDKVREQAGEAGLCVEEGETTSIAYLSQPNVEGTFFCSCDKAAIRLIAYMNLESRAMSVEKALRTVGYHKRNLYPRHYDQTFENCVREGKALRMLYKKLV